MAICVREAVRDSHCSVAHARRAPFLEGCGQRLLAGREGFPISAAAHAGVRDVGAPDVDGAPVLGGFGVVQRAAVVILGVLLVLVGHQRQTNLAFELGKGGDLLLVEEVHATHE